MTNKLTDQQIIDCFTKAKVWLGVNKKEVDQHINAVRIALDVSQAGQVAVPEIEKYVISVQDSFEMLERERPGQHLNGRNDKPYFDWTESRIQVLAETLSEASAKNAGVAPQLTFPHIYLGLKDALLGSMPRWISTADSIPNEDGVLLVVFDPSNLPTIWPAVWNRENSCFDSHGGWFERNEVTHWMPLPVAPSPAKESK
jgi:hypothetical protein